MRLEIQVEGTTEAAFTLLRFGQVASDLREPFREIDGIVRQMFDEQFKTEGAYRSGGWAALARSTEQRRLRRHNAYGRRHPRTINSPEAYGILIETARMYRGAVGTGSKRDTVRQVLRQSLVSGTRVPYAKYHQSKRLPRKHLPRRPLIEFNVDDQLRFAKIIQHYIVATQRRPALLGQL